MYIKNKWISLIFKVLLVAISGYGLSFDILAGRWYSFNFYTVLSNLVCFLYFLVAAIFIIKEVSNGKNTSYYRPRLEAAVVFTITVTFIIFHFLLRPEMFRAGNMAYFYTASNITVHYVVPLMTIADWLLFCPKGKLRGYSPVSWLLIPLAYFTYIMIRAQFADTIGSSGTPYPYYFINVDRLGWGTVLSNILWTAIGMLALAYLIFLIDLAAGRIVAKKQSIKTT